MPNYANGKIYSIMSIVDDKEYIGSTVIPLRQRFNQHKKCAEHYPDRKVYTHFNAIGWDNVRVELLEDCPCNTKHELELRERYYIEHRGAELNALIPTRSAVCEHKRQRAQCHDCNGNSMCVHDRKRQFCKDCNGSGICRHNRQKQYCIDCDGSGLCDHGHQSHQCEACGGSSTKRVVCKCGASLRKGSTYAHVLSKRHKFWKSVSDFIGS